MDVEGYAERLITEALARGELEPAEGTGRPLGRLDRDPDWWIRDFLERETLPDRFTEVAGDVADLTASAISADTLDRARANLQRANERAASWNEEAPEAYRLPERSELWLLDRRAGRPVD